MLSRHLPEDVVTEILSTLPVKSLMRFKSVSKAWYALIRNPHFIAKHDNFAISDHNRNHCRRVILERYRAIDTPRFSMHSNDTLEFSGDIHLIPQLFSEDINPVLFIGSCNGIVCVVGISSERFHFGPDPDRAWEIGLWNPATRESKRLPFVPRPPDFVPFPPDFRVPSYKFGFGIDLNTNDFKVVKITCFYSPRHYQVEVYNLTTDSWRVIDASLNLAHFICRSNFPSYLNGFCYWLIFPRRCDREHNLLLSFDMSNEMFREIMLPDDVRSPADIAIINDSVAVIFPTSIVECSWTKLFTIAVPSRPLQFRDDGLIVLNGGHCVSDKCLVLFDPRTGELKNLPIYDEGSEMFKLVSYRESLVLVNGWRNVLEQQYT
ncbi:F-box/kelch-repeat protein At3g06240-like isoform X2 [Juglans microcarpa x Juglans regia]|uniref:F-box/kelch-repeat protein At3g06240-like isoform X2 n=1 Tax=Juglans microcarpa x Juglans regia TaxID=2249226 RepID=UPI001B7E3756|nr:F-box/kelch-repeat protein At3g06240-like isoform X2 [Juglans microcarpa x Juglans regia]